MTTEQQLIEAERNLLDAMAEAMPAEIYNVFHFELDKFRALRQRLSQEPPAIKGEG